MNTTTAYTPLECLLLFQSLVAYGNQEENFAQISELLTNNALVKDGDTYNAQRLTGDALRELYLELLREELKAEEERQDDGSQTSKKRKLQSPPLPSIKDAQEYRDKLPILVDRLYARYRDYMVREIHEDEKRYAALQQEIREIEAGEWDERILKEDAAAANKNGRASPEDLRPKTNGTGAAEPAKEEEAPEVPKPDLVKDIPANISPRVPSPQTEARPEGLAISDVLNTQDSTAPSSPRTLDSPRTLEPRSRNGSLQATNIPPTHQRTGSNGPHGPSSLQPGPHAGPSYTGPPQAGQQQWKWESYQQPPPPYSVGGPYPQFSSPQYPQQAYPARGSFSAAHGLPPPHSHVPSSPMNPQHPHPILLPPPNPRRSPGSPGMPLDALADAAGQQYRAASGSPMLQQGPPPPAGAYTQPYPPQQRPSSANDPMQPQWNQGYPPPPYPPQQQYQYPPTPNQRPPFQPQPNLMQPENRQYNSPYNASQGPRPPLLASQSSKSRPSLPSTPMLQRPPFLTTGSGTRWTPTPTGSTPRAYFIPDPPEMEPLSPVLRPAKLPEAKKSSKKEKEVQKSEAPKSTKAPRRGKQRARAGTTTSSAVAGSHRSPSVMSHADELSMDEPINHLVKEEVATPAGIEDAGDTTADESSAQPQLPPHLSRQSMKRKRDFSSAVESQAPSTPATHVLWTRAFPKISAQALESIVGHKNASTFASPVKERDAPGYKNLILRPQDLKTIRSAITAGHRAATAAAPDDMNPNASSVWLPITEDIIPPKGIINYAQLEKELMRMFANAIMFNADLDRGVGERWQRIGKEGKMVGYQIEEDSVVKETRAMFADVEKVVGSLRSAERRSEELRESSMAIGNIEDDDADELAGDVDANTGSVAKRRRKA